MKLAMFGVTGVVGSVLLDQALAAGHDVHALVRTASKLRRADRSLMVTEADASDAAAVSSVVAGADAVLSALGGTRGPSSLSAGTDAIMTAMTGHGVRRLILAQGFHLRFPDDAGNRGQRSMGLIMRLVMNGIHQHSQLMAAAVQRSDLDWTVVRFPRVRVGQPQGPHRFGRTLELAPWSTVRDADVAAFMLQCLTEGSYIGQAPMIAT